MQSSTVKEAALRRSLAHAEDETDEEKTLQTREDLINYIPVLGDDCFATSQDTYDSTIAQMKLKNPGVELVTEGTSHLH